MPFGIIGRTGPGMRQVVWFGDRFTGRGTFGANLGHTIVHCPQGPIGCTYATAPQCGPLAKLLWGDLLHFRCWSSHILSYTAVCFVVKCVHMHSLNL